MPRAAVAPTDRAFLGWSPGKCAPTAETTVPLASRVTVIWPPKTEAPPTICW
jgi:hypothetical protein